MKKQNITLFDLGKIPVTPVVNTTGWEDSKTLWERLKQEEADAALAPQRARDAAAAKTQADLENEIKRTNAELTAFWSQPLDVMRSDKAIADSVGFAFGDYELRNGAPVTDGPQVLEAFDQFLTERGIRLANRATFERLRRFMELNVAHGAACTVANWFRSLERLAYLVPEFAQSVEGYTVPVIAKPKPQPAPQKSQQELDNEQIENMDTSTREGQAAAQALASRGWATEVQRLYLDWARNNMEAIWGVPFMKMTSPEVVEWVGEFFNRNNLSPFRADSYDKARRALDHNGILGTVPGSLLLASEKLERSIERSDLNDIEVRQNINRRLADIAKATAPRLR